MEVGWAAVSTRLGYIGLGRNGRRLVATTLPQESAAQAYTALHHRVAALPAVMSEVPLDTFGNLGARLVDYGLGANVSFPVDLDTEHWTVFQRRVWEATRAVPYGETRTYSWVASCIGKPGACRAVGQALNRNPFPIVVPCHRIVGLDRTLTGFGGGLDMKKTLLSLERAPLPRSGYTV